MKIIVAGSGGREHAIAWKLAESDLVSEVVCVPGNGGTQFEKKCRNVLVEGDFIESFVKTAIFEKADFAVIGPEDPLSEGIADALLKAGIPCVGPTKRGAALEASKDLSKQFMQKYGVSCAKSKTFSNAEDALSFVRAEGAPIVIKADGLAAGKGVIVAKTTNEAEEAIKSLTTSLGGAAKKLVIEEYLQGVEISVLAAVSVTEKSAAAGKAKIVPFLPARDHKRLLDGAKGPNTGGMGAVCPPEDVTEETMRLFEERILAPTLRGLIEEKIDYRGFIFFGLMLTKDGPKCLEYNVRLGDPETQAVLPMMDSDFASLCRTITDENGSLSDFSLKWKRGFQVAPVAVSGGYPGKYKKGIPILIETEKIEKTAAKIFVAGAKTNETGKLLTSGGRVLACSAHGESFQEAWQSAYNALSAVHFDEMQYRKDIGLPGAAVSE